MHHLQRHMRREFCRSAFTLARKMTISLGLVLALTPVLSHAADRQWEEAGAAADHTSYLSYATLVRKGQTVQVWEMDNFKAVQSNSDGEYSATVKLMEIRCDRLETRVDRLVLYAGPMATGKVVSDFGRNPSREWRAVIPGTVNATNVRLACTPAAATAKRAGIEPVNNDSRQMMGEKLVDSCMRRHYMTLIAEDAARSGKPVQEGLTIESMPLEKIRAGVQADPSMSKLDKSIAFGCECSTQPMRKLFAKAATEAQLKEATGKIKTMAEDPAVFAQVKQCWVTANAMK